MSPNWSRTRPSRAKSSDSTRPRRWRRCAAISGTGRRRTRKDTAGLTSSCRRGRWHRSGGFDSTSDWVGTYSSGLLVFVVRRNARQRCNARESKDGAAFCFCFIPLLIPHYFAHSGIDILIYTPTVHSIPFVFAIPDIVFTHSSHLCIFTCTSWLLPPTRATVTCSMLYLVPSCFCLSSFSRWDPVRLSTSIRLIVQYIPRSLPAFTPRPILDRGVRRQLIAHVMRLVVSAYTFKLSHEALCVRLTLAQRSTRIAARTCSRISYKSMTLQNTDVIDTWTRDVL